jgi:calcineurin-like phosphoesterase family protein
MRERNDIDPAKTWVISDTHFGHKNIIGYCHRPDDFEQILLNEINAVVREGDTLLHLGDLCYKGNSWFKNVIAPKIASTADVRKLLIAGNHDKQRYSFYKQCGWKLAYPFFIHYLRPGTAPGSLAPPIRVEFDHYPAREYLNGLTWRLHGHIHNNGYYDGRFKSTLGADGLLRMEDHLVPFLRNHINLSCEQTKYKPVRLDLLLDATVYGLLPGDSTPGDGDAPAASDLGKESHHA